MATTTSCSTCASCPRRASRASSPLSARPGIDPASEPIPVAPGVPLRDGRDRHGSRGTLVSARTVRSRRVRLHRAARGEPPRVELAHRMLRPRRRAARSRSRGGALTHGYRRPIHRSWRFDPPTVETREAVWELAGPAAKRRGPGGTAVRPVSARPPDRPLRARAARVPRIPPASGVPRARSRRSTAGTSSAPATSSSGELWA